MDPVLQARAHVTDKVNGPEGSVVSAMIKQLHLEILLGSEVLPGTFHGL